MAGSTPNPSYPGVYIQELSIDPRALTELVQTGSCKFELPEAIFEMAFPGHYMRKIKSVSILMRGVVGRHAGVAAELTLISGKVRMSPKTSGDPGDFTISFPSTKSKVTSSGPNNSGTFELNFQGEGYLPFEGHGAISSWSLTMLQRQNFDFSTITDVVIRVTYTARDGGAPTK